MSLSIEELLYTMTGMICCSGYCRTQRRNSKPSIPGIFRSVRTTLGSGTSQYADRFNYPLPDLILFDLKMPRVDGFEVLKWTAAGLNSGC